MVRESREVWEKNASTCGKFAERYSLRVWGESSLRMVACYVESLCLCFRHQKEKALKTTESKTVGEWRVGRLAFLPKYQRRSFPCSQTDRHRQAGRDTVGETASYFACPSHYRNQQQWLRGYLPLLLFMRHNAAWRQFIQGWKSNSERLSRIHEGTNTFTKIDKFREDFAICSNDFSIIQRNHLKHPMREKLICLNGSDYFSE